MKTSVTYTLVFKSINDTILNPYPANVENMVSS